MQDNLELRIHRTSDGKYEMTITKSYNINDRRKLITKIDEDLTKLVQEFEEALKENEKDNER